MCNTYSVSLFYTYVYAYNLIYIIFIYIYIYTYTPPLHPYYIPQPWRVLTSLQAGGVAAHVEVGGRG